MVHLRLHQSFHWRLVILISFFLTLLAAVILRVFSLAIVEYRRFVVAAEKQQQIFEVLPSRRGKIFAQDKSGVLLPLAIQKSFFTLVAVPKDISDHALAASNLGELLSVQTDDIYAKLAKADDPYEVIARKIDDETAAGIRALNTQGLMLVEESRRVYPQNRLAASVIGFVSYDDGEERGEYGIERAYQKELEGDRGFFEGEKDAAGFWVSVGRRIINPPVNGADVILTIDANIQFKVEEELISLREKWQAESALAIAIEPSSGRILALASSPAFDPNDYSSEKDFSVFRAPAINSQFELGSVFKPITMAAGINEGVISATTTYQDPGRRKYGGFTVSNFDGRSYGLQTMTQVLERSLNTGAIFAAERVGKERFWQYLQRFGFGQKAEIDFPGEVVGDISNLNAGRDVDYATASFGQGIAITPLQMAMAMGAIANRGILMTPYMVERIRDEAGVEELHRPTERGEVISISSAETITKMLVSAVRNGFENRAGVNGYFVAGKTGTAQIPKKDGRGYSDEVIHTFVGYAPAFNPKFLILLQLNRPKGNRFAANTLTPAFHNLAEFMLNYYEIPSDER